MAEYLQVWRARVPDVNVEPLLAIRPAAIAEAQRLAPRAGRRRPRPLGRRHLARLGAALEHPRR